VVNHHVCINQFHQAATLSHSSDGHA
jgi:hypothetical protein